MAQAVALGHKIKAHAMHTFKEIGMDDDQFEALVSRMEPLLQRSPAACKTRVLALAGLLQGSLAQ